MSASGIYNQRPIGSHMRIGDALDAVKHEYDLVANELVQARTVRDEYEAKVTSQINELNIIRQALYELEAQHGKVRQRYEDEIQHLRAELHTLRQLPGPGVHGSGPGIHPSSDAYRDRNGDRPADRYSDRERERERERDRERDRDRERGGERDPKRLKIKGPGGALQPAVTARTNAKRARFTPATHRWPPMRAVSEGPLIAPARIEAPSKSTRTSHPLD
ncbi:Chromatin associated protein [Mycena sanguinolenta]|uniref:Chromatin associated protein n=1 Tax=Mycena sanguinolenta TaxID=230812 RepID=A0A8H6Y461_9AGAR|nr:Chromatin associated protein [Mycena sanguinolenta]